MIFQFMKNDVFNELKSINGIEVKENVTITNTMNIKAVFRFYVNVMNLNSLSSVMKLIKKNKIKYYILGNASNVLFKKDYYDGVVIKVNPNFNNNDKLSGNLLLSQINNEYMKQGISSLLFLSMVPGSLGGAICMNAGAFSREIKEIVEFVYFYDIKKDKFRVFSNKECKFKYRDSYFKHHETIILGAKVKLEYADINDLYIKHNKIMKTRKEKLPYKKPSLGSVFKNFKDLNAGFLIDKAGLKGVSINDAKVSEKHANIIVNEGSATGKDVIDLINIIKKNVWDKYKRNLELEIIIFE